MRIFREKEKKVKESGGVKNALAGNILFVPWILLAGSMRHSKGQSLRLFIILP
jgi:hypothetical protein